MILYAVVVAGFSVYLLLKAFDLLSTAGLAVAEEAAAVTASAAAVTALATIALVWTAIQQASEGCQWPVGSARWRTAELPSCGQQNCPFVADRFAHCSVGQWRHPLSGGGLGEADAVAGGEDDVGVVQ